jgi:hypothetical protein
MMLAQLITGELRDAPGAGRPAVKYTPAVALRVCELVSQDVDWRVIHRLTGVNQNTAIQWSARYPSFRGALESARELSGGAIVSKINTIEAATVSGLLPAPAANVVLRSMQWRASRANPLKYGDNLTLRGDRRAPLYENPAQSLTDSDLLALALDKPKVDENDTDSPATESDFVSKNDMPAAP